ncbi:MAG: hypothetical protein IPK82_02795 [Polyangiaceae bacterium]|nr:hypothetical protein [Polyangiaceae bacterium]
MLRRRTLAPTIALVFSCLTAPAWAQQPTPEPTPAPAPTAAELRDKGRAALAAGDVAGACILFEQSYQAASKPGAAGPPPDEVLFDLAECHEKQGKGAIAAAEYEQVASGASSKSEEAKKRAAALRSPPKPGPTETPTQPAGTTTTTKPVAPPPPPPEEKTLKDVLPTRIGDFMDTRLTWTFGDDDILRATGLAQPISPDSSIADRRTYRLFFDNLNSRFGGRENLTHLSLYKKIPGFAKHLDTEAAVNMRIDFGELARGTNNLNRALYDSGSYIRVFYHTDGKDDGKVGLNLTLFPLDTDRMRLGYLYDISWGGTAASINQSIFPRIQGLAPGGKIQYDGENWGAYIGFKTATIVQTEIILRAGGANEVDAVKIGQTNYGVMGGANVDIADVVRIDLGAGYFQQGKFDLPGVFGQPVYTFGEAARVVIHKNQPAPQSVDFLLYRNDPNRPQIIFKPETYTPGKTSWSISLEEDVLLQNLATFEVAGQTELQPAIAAALQANIKSGYLRASATGIYRDLPYVLRNQPSFIPFQTIPKAASTSNELFFAVALDYHFPNLHLTPGIGAGLQFPSQFKTSSIDADSAPIDRTVVVREQGNIAILPLNRNAVPIFQGRVSLRWDLSQILNVLVWLQYVRDNNGTFVERDPNEGTVALRTFVAPDFLGFGMAASARY